jgi:hypothetical protein
MQVSDAIALCEEQISIWQKCLESYGWKVANDTVIPTATKNYKTAVGVKVAFAYFNPPDHYYYHLTGDYQSKGRNILSSSGELIPVSSSPEDFRKQVAKFADNADALIACSFAMRLLN